MFTEEERKLVMHGEFIQSRSLQNLMSAAVNLYAAKLGQKQAEANDRHAKAMKWLTIALFVAAAVAAVSTAVSALIQAGVF